MSNNHRSEVGSFRWLYVFLSFLHLLFQTN